MKRRNMTAILCAAAMLVSLTAGCGSKPAGDAGVSGDAASGGSGSTEEASGGSGSTEEASGGPGSADDAQATADGSGTAQAGGGIDTSEKRVIHFLSTWPETDPNVKILRALTEEYQKEVDPNIELEVEVITGDAIQRQVKIYNSSNDLPDIFTYFPGRPLQVLIDMDAVVDIEEEFGRLGIYDSIDSGAVSLLKTFEGNQGGLHALPIGMNLEGFWYNKQIFEEYDLEVPETWDDMLAVCETLTENGVTAIGLGGKQKWPVTRLMNAYIMRSMGPEAMYQASVGEIPFDDPGFIEAGEMVKSMVDAGYFGDGYITMENADAENMLMSGQCAMIYDGSWIVGNLLNDPEKNPLGEDVGFFNIPAVTGGASDQEAYSMNCGSALILAKSKYDDRLAGWCEYVFPRMGNKAMEICGESKGYTVTEAPETVSYYTQMVNDELAKVKSTSLFFEALMDDETTALARDNAQAVCLGTMSAEEYFKTLHEANARYLESQN